jgi:hypothetical protein
MMDIKTEPKEVVYMDIQRQYEELSRLFSKKDSRGVPILAIFDVEDIDKESWRVRETLEFYPETPSEETIKDIVSRTYDSFGSCRYSRDNHAVIINRAVSNGRYPLALAEEVTHSVVPVDDEIVKVGPEDFREFNGYSAGFGSLVYRVLEPLKIGEFKLNLNEFFPPLGQAHLKPDELRARKYDWERAFRSIGYMHPEKQFFERAMRAHSLVEHVPQIAGKLLVDTYKRDIEALVREHPQLVNLSGSQLWVQYCKPLLTSGKLE